MKVPWISFIIFSVWHREDYINLSASREWSWHSVCSYATYSKAAINREWAQLTLGFVAFKRLQMAGHSDGN